MTYRCAYLHLYIQGATPTPPRQKARRASHTMLKITENLFQFSQNRQNSVKKAKVDQHVDHTQRQGCKIGVKQPQNEFWGDHLGASVVLLGITSELFWTLQVPLGDFLGPTWSSKGLSQAPKQVSGDNSGASWEHFGGLESVYEAIRCNMQKPSKLL